MFGLRAIKDSSEHTGSYYAASRSPALEYPPLADAIDCDVVIVGGGFLASTRRLSSQSVVMRWC